MVFQTNFFKKLSLLAAAAFFSSSLMAAPTKEAGKELFVNNCASCHNKNMKDDMTGPALAGVEDRWSAFPRKDLYAWIRNSQALIAAGHPRAKEVFAKWKTNMNPFPGLTDEQIESIVLYINNPAGPKATTPVAGESKEESSNTGYFVALALLLLVLAFALNKILTNLNNVAREKDGQLPEFRTFNQWLTSSSTIAFLTFLLILLGGAKMVDNATRMGRQQHYEPTQPIKFSHKTHAGIQKIDCQYCHDGARRSKQSVIPATNTCMNCHAAVTKGSQYGTGEISKIFASIGYDPIAKTYIPNYETLAPEEVEAIYKKWIGQAYMEDKQLTSLDEAGKIQVENQWTGIVAALTNPASGDTKIQGPIEWTRIHNLADHAYFNHAQHVTVGQVACQKCHGPVEKMDEVYQFANLSMGWCVNCHRETAVKFEDNAYYKQFEQLHKDIKSGKKEKVTVEDIGGLECQKCHY